MNLNLLVIPTLVIALVLFRAGEVLLARCKRKDQRISLIVVAVAVAVPGVLIALYYFHLCEVGAWFYQFRSLPFAELTAGGAGLLAGVLSGLLSKSKAVSRAFLIIVLCLGVAGPHLKPVIAPVSSGSFIDKWSDGVCLQSTQSSCGPASAATIFRIYGVDVTEREIARECYTYRGGTENWYIARAFRRRGFRVHFQTHGDLPSPLPAPAIAGVEVGAAGHFIPILSATQAAIVTGDPMLGRRTYSPEELAKVYRFTGFFMVIRKDGE